MKDVAIKTRNKDLLDLSNRLKIEHSLEIDKVKKEVLMKDTELRKVKALTSSPIRAPSPARVAAVDDKTKALEDAEASILQLTVINAAQADLIGLQDIMSSLKESSEVCLCNVCVCRDVCWFVFCVVM